jgi:hypothetical protein
LLVEQLASQLNQSSGVEVDNSLQRHGTRGFPDRCIFTLQKLEKGGEDLRPTGDGNDMLRNLVVGKRLVLGDGLDKLEVVGSDHVAGQADDTVGNCGRNEHGLANLLFGFGKALDDFVELSLEADIEHSVGLIQDQSSQVGGINAAAGVLEKIVQTTRSSDKKMATISTSLVKHAALVSATNSTLDDETSV